VCVYRRLDGKKANLNAIVAFWELDGFAEVFLEGKISIGGRIGKWNECRVERLRVHYRMRKAAK
jgi:hypothetical protein